MDRADVPSQICPVCQGPRRGKKFCSAACSNRNRVADRSLVLCRTIEEAKRMLWESLCKKVESGCWEFHQGKRYGTIKYDGVMWATHRLSYFFATGRDPGEFLVMHSCDNPKCINPDHLSLGMPKNNSEDMVAKGRSCKGKQRPGTGPAGERNVKAKLTRDQVEQLKIDHATGDYTYRSLGLKHGISKSQVGNILNGDQWRSEIEPL